MTTRQPDIARLRERTSEKWRKYPEDVLPLFVAEMDYALAPDIAQTMTTGRYRVHGRGTFIGVKAR